MDQKRNLGTSRRLLLGVQHLFAMFGATVLVPALTGLNVSTTLFFAGVGTLVFHLVTGGTVPAFLGSSFAFLGGYAAVAPMLTDPVTGLTMPNTAMLPYACAAVTGAGLVYLAMAALVRRWGTERVMAFFPPAVTGPVIICIGLSLAGSAVSNCRENWLVALAAALSVVLCSIRGRGMVRIIPVLLGVAIAYTLAMVMDPAVREHTFQTVAAAAWLGMPIVPERTAPAIFGAGFDPGLLLNALITMLPIALVTVVEHIGDMCAISSTVGKNFVADPGLSRTLTGDGLATALSAFFGGPANTTYGENTGVLALSRVFDPGVVRLAAVFSVILSFCPKFAALIAAMPAAVMGGVSVVLYGMICTVGIRNMAQSHTDLDSGRNGLIAALILVLGIGISYSGAIVISLGDVTVSVSGLAAAALTGIAMNALLPETGA